MKCQIQLVNMGSSLGVRITESVFRHKTIVELPYSLKSDSSLLGYINAEIIRILWDGMTLESRPPQYRIVLVFGDGYPSPKITISSLQFRLLSQVCVITKI